MSTTSHNLQITSVKRNQDGTVSISAMFLKIGVYTVLPWATKAYPPGDNAGFPMTKAANSTTEPIIISGTGQMFTFVWDALADGFDGADLGNWCFALVLVDLYCCEEEEEEELDPTPPPPLPPGVPPPLPGDDGSPSGDPDGSAPDPDPDELPPPSNDDSSGTPPDATDPDDPNWLPPNETSLPGGTYPLPGAGGEFGFYADGAGNVYDSSGNLITTQTVSPFYYMPADELDTLQGELVTQEPSQVTNQGYDVNGTQPDSLVAPSQTTPIVTSDIPITYKTYREADISPSIYSLSSDNGDIRITAFTGLTQVPQDWRTTIHFVVRNLTDGYVGPFKIYVEGMDSGGNRFVLQEMEDMQPPKYPDPSYPNALPPLQGSGMTICANWLQFLAGAANVSVVVMSPSGTPILAAIVPINIMPPTGGLPPPMNQPPEELPQRIREMAGGGLSTAWPSNITASFEGSVNAIGDEDTFLFTATNDRVGIVVRITPDAEISGFDPLMEIYSVDDPDTPLVSTSSRFTVMGQEIETEYHSIGWIDDDDDILKVLTPGQEYFIVIKHVAPFWSRRWGFRIYLRETVRSPSLTVKTDETTMITDGTLDAAFSCAYGRQSIKLLNPRTNEHIFVRTDYTGRLTSTLSAAKPNGTTLAVDTGDVIEILRPGMGVQYRRHHDNLGVSSEIY